VRLALVCLASIAACAPAPRPVPTPAPTTDEWAADTHGRARRPHAPKARPGEATPGDRDGDGIADDVDKCPDDPEDFDGFEDEDGCPDPDNDRDGIPDVDDKCPNVPETFNGFEDQDGCPDSLVADRDGDGIPDNVDKCPDDPEDKDGFQDDDGCPDPDNDHDGIPDVDDLCPNDPEDKDGFQDDDGCPDPDNDHDGIPDRVDKCPNQPETYNGFQDEDGCPDRGRVIIEGDRLKLLDPIAFDGATIKSPSSPILTAVAATLKGNPQLTLVEVRATGDQRGERAAAVRRWLVAHGVQPERLRASGQGGGPARIELVILKRGP
jgi:hypothetical protein